MREETIRECFVTKNHLNGLVARVWGERELGRHLKGFSYFHRVMGLAKRLPAKGGGATNVPGIPKGKEGRTLIRGNQLKIIQIL